MENDLAAQLARQMETLPERLGGHIFLTLAALSIGVAISLPLGVLASRRPRLEKSALTIASIIQTIPGLALLAIMVFVCGTIGWIPALIALVLYSILPTLRNTVVGLNGISPAILEAARGVGMDNRQMLAIVQLPLALPTIVAGIRTASVWVVGAATIAQPVGATSLGNYVFVGLQTLNAVSLLFGCILSAALALVLDGLLHSLEISVRNRSRRRAVTTMLGIAGLAVTPLALDALPTTTVRGPLTVRHESTPESDQPYVVAGKAFTEQYIWSELIQRRLSAAGLSVDVRDGMGSATVFRALEAGQIDCYVDYTGTIWTNYMHRTDVATPVEMLIDVAAYLKQVREIYCVGPLGFSNDYAFATRRDVADRYRLTSLTDLARVSSSLNGGTDIEFFDRPEWRAVQQAYGLEFRQQTTMDPTLMYGAIAAGQLDVIIAFNTDARLEKYDLVVLDDPRYALPPYDAVLLVSRRMVRDARAMRALRPLIYSVDSETMRRANGWVDLDGKSAARAAEQLLQGIQNRQP